MDYSEPMGDRCNVRADRPDPVEEEKFLGILAAIRVAFYFDQWKILINPEIDV